MTSCAVYCDFCEEEIEHCEGRYGYWMHTFSRRETCSTAIIGSYFRTARPEPVKRVLLRHYGRFVPLYPRFGPAVPRSTATPT